MSETTATTESTSSSGSTTGSKSVTLPGLGGIVGLKAGMTQVFNENGESIAVTVIDLSPCIVTQVKTKEKNGYQGVQIGLLEKKEKSAKKSEKGHAKKVGKNGFYYTKEFRLEDSDKMDGIEPGSLLSPEFLKEGDLVDLTSISKGKGFQGVMKRFHFAGGMASHGASICHRMPGSIGNRADPGRVFKGKKMAGQMGHVKTTVQNVRVVKVDADNGLLLVHGSVPGPRSGIVTVQKAVKVAG